MCDLRFRIHGFAQTDILYVATVCRCYVELVIMTCSFQQPQVLSLAARHAHQRDARITFFEHNHKYFLERVSLRLSVVTLISDV